MEGFLLSAAQLRAFSEALYRLYAGVPLEDFPRVLMESIESVIHCPTMCFNEVNLTSGEIHTAYNGHVYDEAIVAHWPEFAQGHPGIAHVAAGGTMRVLAITDFVTQRQFRQTELYQNIFRPLAVESQLVAVIPMEGYATGISLNRDGHFSARDKLLLELFHPHILRAYSHARVLAATRQPESAAPDFLAWRRLGLTRRECQILHWVTEGKRDSEIAIILQLSRRTINHHVANILRKLDVENRATAARQALDLLRS
jgi:DNA-binding CsgD family transcriptional regulator